MHLPALREPTAGSDPVRHAHRLVRSLAAGAFLAALGYAALHAAAFVEQLVRLAAGALR